MISISTLCRGSAGTLAVTITREWEEAKFQTLLLASQLCTHVLALTPDWRCRTDQPMVHACQRPLRETVRLLTRFRIAFSDELELDRLC
jgi:hypothetical protein